MALKLTQDFKGISVNYWKITQVIEDYRLNSTKVILSLYKDKATRTANIGNILQQREFIFDGIESDRAVLYGKIKEPINEEIYNPIDNVYVTQQINIFVDATDA